MGALTILGGGGFVGSRYVKEFYDPAIGNIASVNKRDDYNVYSADVLYLISTVHNSNVYVDPYLDINTNLVTLIKVLENWRARTDASEGVFNFISSWFVDSEVQGFYTSTKRCAEELLVAYCKAYGLRYRILRLSNVVGPGDKVTDKKNALQSVVRKLQNNLRVYLHGRGDFRRSYIHVKDCVRAIELIMSKGEENTIYSVCNENPWVFAEIIRYLHGYLNSESEVVELPGTVDSSHMDPERLKALGYSPKYAQNRLYESLCEEK